MRRHIGPLNLACLLLIIDYIGKHAAIYIAVGGNHRNPGCICPLHSRNDGIAVHGKQYDSHCLIIHHLVYQLQIGIVTGILSLKFNAVCCCLCLHSVMQFLRHT